MKTICALLTFILCVSFNVSWALTTESNTSTQTEVSTSSSAKVHTTTVIIKKIDGNTIYTNAGTYSISGAKVSDFTKDKKFKSDSRKAATLTFIEGRLVDVVIK